MSCPYLEKGRVAYCHAFGGQRLGVESSESETVCFSGDFSECSFLFSPLSQALSALPVKTGKWKARGNDKRRSID
jgi:hypothetical protein